MAQAEARASTIAQDLPTLLAQQAQMINAIGLPLAEPPRTRHDVDNALTGYAEAQHAQADTLAATQATRAP